MDVLTKNNREVTYKFESATEDNLFSAFDSKVLGIHFSGHGEKQESSDYILLEDKESVA